LRNSALNHIGQLGEADEEFSLISCLSRHGATLGLIIERELIPVQIDSAFGKMQVLLLRFRPQTEPKSVEE
jgi:hypothetical protein